MSAAKRKTAAGRAAEKARDRKRYIHNRKRVLEDAYDRMNPAKTYPLEYRRGVLHGLQAGMAIAYNHNGGRSWSNAEICGEIQDLTADLPAAIVVIGDALTTDDVIPPTADIHGAFWAPRRK